MMNDIHLNLTYSEECKFPFCYTNGRYGLDSPGDLLDTMIEDLNGQYNSNDQIDVLVLSGDFVMHGMAAKTPGESDWDSMKEIIEAATTKIQKKFPTTLMLPCIGNNDVVEHY